MKIVMKLSKCLTLLLAFVALGFIILPNLDKDFIKSNSFLKNLNKIYQLKLDTIGLQLLMNEQPDSLKTTFALTLFKQSMRFDSSDTPLLKRIIIVMSEKGEELLELESYEEAEKFLQKAYDVQYEYPELFDSERRSDITGNFAAALCELEKFEASFS